MEQKEQYLLSRLELAARLRQIAAQFERGEVRVGKISAALPEWAELEIGLAEDAATVALTLAVRWPPEAAHRLA